MREIGLLVVAAFLEVGGDACARWGLRTGRLAGLLLAAALLTTYGIAVNLPKWDFGRLLGVYIAIFFVVSQLVACIAFHEKLCPQILVGGALIVGGGLVLTLWRPAG